MVSSIVACFKKYVDFHTRSARSEFWWWQLLVFVISFLAALTGGGLFVMIELICLVPSVAVGVRRLHDINRSGWWVLLELTIIGIIPLFYWALQPGTRGPNKYGPDPLIGRFREHDSEPTSEQAAPGSPQDSGLHRSIEIETVLGRGTNAACSKCGAELLPEDSFCRSCGAPIPENTSGSNHPENHCSKCGAELLPEDSFCRSCGGPIPEDTSGSTVPENHCGKCGATLLPQDGFCRSCGTAI
jgi:uncharacterized membrane protein YhaH (DUF805 family)/uncharacterized OB-fold protein